MTIKILSAIPTGYTASPVIIECDRNKGLPRFDIVGLPSRTINESRERIRFALKNSGFIFPKDHLVINLAPASLQKTGNHLDLPIALSILALSSQVPLEALRQTIFVGELALNGALRPVSGILSIVEYAKHQRLKQLIVPAQNYHQALLLAPDNINIIPTSSLHELWQILINNQKPIYPPKHVVKNTNTGNELPKLDQIIGQEQAKRAIVVAMAGRHNILLFGPPGAGKSLIAKVANNLQTPLRHDESISTTKIYSLSNSPTEIIAKRPFRAPHHSISRSTMIGNSIAAPGEISLSHNGILFLDELPEFRRDILEALRQPLEDKMISIGNIKHRAQYPANFMLIATMNPCPCGYLGSNTRDCRCTMAQIKNYHHRISGPLLDRIDLQIKVNPVNSSVLLKNTTISNHEHETAKSQIRDALNTQFERSGKPNSDLSSVETIRYCQLAPDIKLFYDNAASKLNLSARAYFKTLKLSRTIADIEKSHSITIDHLSEALQYRAQF